MDQISNLKVDCKLSNLLAAERWLHIVEKLSDVKESHLMQTDKFTITQF